MIKICLLTSPCFFKKHPKYDDRYTIVVMALKYDNNIKKKNTKGKL